MGSSLTEVGATRVGYAASETPEAVALPTGTRWWFAGFVAWMGVLALAAVVLLEAFDQGSGLALRAWIVVLMCFYLSLCNAFVPLPTAWIVLLAASPKYALLPDPVLSIVLVAILATVSTVMANLNEYHLLAYLLHFGLGERVRRSRVYGWAIRWFNRAPFQMLALIAFVPIPVDAVRWLAVLRGYSRKRFALAYLVGRGPRYVLFAGCSVLFSLTAVEILLIQGGLIGAALFGRLVVYLVRRRSVGVGV